MKKFYFKVDEQKLTKEEIKDILANGMQSDIIAKNLRNEIVELDTDTRYGDDYYVNCIKPATEFHEGLHLANQNENYGTGMSVPVGEDWILARAAKLNIPEILLFKAFDINNCSEDEDPCTLVFDIERRVKGATLLDKDGNPVMKKDKHGNETSEAVVFEGPKSADLKPGDVYYTVTSPRVEYGDNARRTRDEYAEKKALAAEPRARLRRRRAPRIPSASTLA
jgi:hypothetical protein